MLPDDVARKRDEEARRASVSEWLKNHEGARRGKQASTKAGREASPADNHALTQSQSPLCQSADVDRRRCPCPGRLGRVSASTATSENGGFRSCDLISGKEGEIGAVRTIGDSVIVGQTRYSYTYTQPMRATGLYPMYHGTLEARSLGSGRTTLYYTLGPPQDRE